MSEHPETPPPEPNEAGKPNTGRKVAAAVALIAALATSIVVYQKKSGDDSPPLPPGFTSTAPFAPLSRGPSVIFELTGDELHIDFFQVDSITNFLGTDAKRFTFITSNQEVGSTNAILFKQDLTDPNMIWITIGAYVSTNTVNVHARTNAQAFLQNGGFFRIWEF